MVRDYELMYIVRPELDDEALRAATESVETLIRGLGGTVGKTTMWGKRRLAYAVDRLRDGHYVIALVQLDGDRVSELERSLQIHDTVFRHLLVRQEETATAEGAAEAAGTGGETGGASDGPDAEAAAEAAGAGGETGGASDSSDAEAAPAGRAGAAASAPEDDGESGDADEDDDIPPADTGDEEEE